MKYTIERTNTFKRSLKRCLKRGLDENKFKEVVILLATNGVLPPKYRPHKLVGKYSGCWECHIEPDWLLVWEQNDSTLNLLMIDTGSHADIFG
ncbi:MAG: type II toxin-antitoxin system YafQ family toxin [Muribaculaceae bacterium]|nr:type II toxin-antitoxin system YafQ family toxin [Muribaculaceae bacterium]